jgi:putative nucleotidyltransferase with HDIG domain
LNQTQNLPKKQICIITKSGKTVHVERTAKLLSLPGKDCALITLFDLTERIQTEATLRRQAQELLNRVEQLQKAWYQTINVLAAATEAKDPYTSGHQKRVTPLAVAIAKELKMPENEVMILSLASLIHDIGKVTLPAEFLSKPGKLNSLEYQIVQQHATGAYNLLKGLDLPWNIADIIYPHHERCNGSGYPNKLKSGQILFSEKILGVADVVEAMSSHRPYRPSLGIDAALAEIEKEKGYLYDPEIVDVCLKLFREQLFAFE